MAELLKGAAVTAVLDQRTAERTAALRAKGVVPALAILRVGERPDAVSYERSVIKRCAAVGVEALCRTLPEDVDSDTFFRVLGELNADSGIHGILLLQPLPPQIDAEKARRAIAAAKDVDGGSDGSLATVFRGSGEGFVPCTARAVMEILHHYGVAPDGKKAVVVGRSLVVGRPVAMLLLQENATVTVCHSHTADPAAVIREADIVVAALSRPEALGRECFRPGQTVVDVGIHWNEAKGRLCGDVAFDEVEPVVAAITPVPGGVGPVTSSVMAAAVAEAAEHACR